jgi:hypothetical protein
MKCYCQIIPNDVLERFSRDPRLSADERKNFADTALVDAQMRKLRVQAGKLTAVTASLGLAATVTQQHQRSPSLIVITARPCPARPSPTRPHPPTIQSSAPLLKPRQWPISTRPCSAAIQSTMPA